MVSGFPFRHARHKAQKRVGGSRISQSQSQFEKHPNFNFSQHPYTIPLGRGQVRAGEVLAGFFIVALNQAHSTQAHGWIPQRKHHKSTYVRTQASTLEKREWTHQYTHEKRATWIHCQVDKTVPSIQVSHTLKNSHSEHFTATFTINTTNTSTQMHTQRLCQHCSIPTSHSNPIFHSPFPLFNGSSAEHPNRYRPGPCSFSTTLHYTLTESKLLTTFTDAKEESFQR